MSARVSVDSLIESIPGVYGGRPRLARSGFPIIQLVADYQNGMRVSDFLAQYPHIDEASIDAGIAYYFANKEALDHELDEREALGERLKAEWQASQLAAAPR